MGARGPLNEGMRTRSGPSSYQHHPPAAARPAGRKTRIGDFSVFYRDSASFSSTQIPKGTEGCDLRGAENRGRSTCYATYVDEPLMMVTGASTKHYFHANHLYSVAAMTNSTGAVVERYRYDAYGKRTVTNAAGTSMAASGIGQQRGFTGYHLDEETGLYYARARMYSAGLGRFISRDSYSEKIFAGVHVPAMGAGYQEGASLYGAYFIPNRMDPSGHVSQCEISLYVGHLGEAVAWINKQTLDDQGARRPRPCGSAIGTVSCMACDVVPQIPEDLAIPGFLDGLSGKTEVIKCKGLYDQYKQALAKAKADAPRLCKEGCCKYIKITVDCSSDAKDCFSGKDKLPNYVRRNNRWVQDGYRNNGHWDVGVSDPTACGSVTVVDCPK